MPTHEETNRFRRDFEHLSDAERAAFLASVRAFIDDLESGAFRKGLRVKGMSGRDNVWELTVGTRWARHL